MELHGMFGPKFSIEKAHKLQLELSKKVIRQDKLPKTLRFTAGVDVAYVDDFSIGAVAVFECPSVSLVETQVACVRASFPYIPTLLSWRELEPAQAAIKKLKTQADVFLVDAHGIAHPYRLGFASHLGLVLNKPTIGVAKSLLSGSVESANQQDWAPIIDKGEVVGAAVKTDPKGKPVYVSIGHKVSLETAIKIVRNCTKSSRIPEPIRLAHGIAAEEKEKFRLKQLHKVKEQ